MRRQFGNAMEMELSDLAAGMRLSGVVAGKTIMSGLFIRELMLRVDVTR